MLRGWLIKRVYFFILSLNIDIGDRIWLCNNQQMITVINEVVNVNIFQLKNIFQVASRFDDGE